MICNYYPSPGLYISRSYTILPCPTNIQTGGGNSIQQESVARTNQLVYVMDYQGLKQWLIK